jgi:outer membrane protein TolC
MSPVRSIICSAFLSLYFGTQAFGQATSPFLSTPFSSSISSTSSHVQPGGAGVPLTLQKAIEMALQTNLNVLLSQQSTRAAKGQRLRALSQVLPNITSGVSEHVVQENLAASGIKFPGVPEIVGPFSFFDARLFLSQSLFDLSRINRARAAGEDLSAAQFSYQETRNLIVAAAASAYLRALSDSARITTAQAQVDTGRALYKKAVDLHNAGLSPAIDSVRAQVQLQAREQQLIVAKNAYSRDVLDVARVIGLPLGQSIEFADRVPYSPLDSLTLEQAIDRAAKSRPELKSALSRLRSTELSRSAASAERLPSFSADADYGGTGLTPGSSRATFNVAGTMRLPIFDSGRIRGDVLEADAAMQQQRAQVHDLRLQVEYEVRSAFLDLSSAADQVRVATSSVDLAKQALDQSRDRFSSGVADNLEVVQAQEAFAGANETYISSVFFYNLSKLSLARSIGVAEGEARTFLEGK